MGITLDHHSLGLEPVTCRSKPLRPPQSLENWGYWTPGTPGCLWLLLWDPGVQLLSVPLLSHFSFSLFFEANKVGWEPAKPAACGASEQVLSSLTFFPNCCGLCKALPNGGWAHCLLQSLSEIISWNTVDPRLWILGIHCQPFSCVAPIYEPVISSLEEASWWYHAPGQKVSEAKFVFDSIFWLDGVM